MSHTRTGWHFPLLFVVLTGCSAEPTSVQQPVASKPAETASPSVTEPTPWNVNTLKDGEFAIEEGFRTLTFDDFEVFFAKPPKEGPATWQSIQDAIVCYGKPKGYIYSKETFKEFTLKLDFRFAPSKDELESKSFNPNTGVLVFITPPHKQWPKSLEVQGKFAELCSIKPNGGAAAVELQEDSAARDSARKPVGEWNEIEIIAKAGALTAKLNGTMICSSQPGELTEGAIGLQSEDFEVHFRRLRIRTE